MLCDGLRDLPVDINGSIMNKIRVFEAFSGIGAQSDGSEKTAS